MNAPNERDRPDEPWKYPYVAGVLDFGSNFRVRVTKDDGARFGHVIHLQIHIENTQPVVMGFLDEFCMNHGIEPRVREREENFRLELSKRDDVRDFLRLIRPYILVRAEAVEVALEDLIPGLENRLGSTEEGFLELMGYVDEIRSHTTQRSEPKYTQDYFRNEFNL